MKCTKVWSLSLGIGLAAITTTGCGDDRQPTPVSAKSDNGGKPSDASTSTNATNAPESNQVAQASPSSSNATADMGKFSTTKTSFGKLADGREATLYTITSPSGAKLEMTDYGATIVKLEMPDKNGKLANVNLNEKTVGEYEKNTAHFGATIGRYGNRIAKGKFTLDGKEYTLETNNGVNHLHGGTYGYDHQMWTAKEVDGPDAAGLQFTYVSKDGDANYPGTLTATATYWLTKNNELKIDYTANTDKDTVLNLTNHAYWNLAGAGSGDILKHEMMINADKYLAVDDTLIPTGEMPDVKGGPMDLTTAKPLGPGVADIKTKGGMGYDHCYVLRNQSGKSELAAKVKDPASGRTMEVWTDQPGIQLYTGNFLDGSANTGGYRQHNAFCLETQHYPDSPNHPEFPSTVLKPGETYKTTTIYKFGVEK